MNNKKTTIHPNKVVHDLSNLQKKDYCNSFRINTICNTPTSHFPINYFRHSEMFLRFTITKFNEQSLTSVSPVVSYFKNFCLHIIQYHGHICYIHNYYNLQL